VNRTEALNFGEAMLREYGISDPRWNAERILLIALKLDRAKLFSDLKTDLSNAEEISYRAMLSRRALNYPLAYLEGVQEFYGREFKVDESVLIPRPETEEIIRAISKLSLPSLPMILDVGAGSGAIAVTIAEELPGAKVTALEISPGAMRTLSENARGKVSLIRGDLYHLPFQNEAFDVIASNPPYVELSEFNSLPEETRWEPREALVGANDLYPVLLNEASRVLRPRGYLVFEIGFNQAAKIQELCNRSDHFELVEIRLDHQQIPRAFVLKKKRSILNNI
jgi:release factor glutamine methyltransferase